MWIIQFHRSLCTKMWFFRFCHKYEKIVIMEHDEKLSVTFLIKFEPGKKMKLFSIRLNSFLSDSIIIYNPWFCILGLTQIKLFTYPAHKYVLFVIKWIHLTGVKTVAHFTRTSVLSCNGCARFEYMAQHKWSFKYRKLITGYGFRMW